MRRVNWTKTRICLHPNVSQSASVFLTQVLLFLACVLTKDREITLLNQLVSSQLKFFSF